ncbi:uncharacterized protein EV420DRAFT_557590 [Desarmillaria tabescens]|uniref:Uncharacterized protein n=1 Tax=Armillaria tabescens TaxID=1929756 RepID=A0AA39K7H3_ARMTA|nr:uncharacterized protein EV420DRAFT_557590 [Desarmillaria tabescens]KAK0455723.1 hypothetical protein EV420DRAFT_557590 [Desarmillaria tabescens]
MRLSKRRGHYTVAVLWIRTTVCWHSGERADISSAAELTSALSGKRPTLGTSTTIPVDTSKSTLCPNTNPSIPATRYLQQPRSTSTPIQSPTAIPTLPHHPTLALVLRLHRLPNFCWLQSHGPPRLSRPKGSTCASYWDPLCGAYSLRASGPVESSGKQVKEEFEARRDEEAGL